MRELLSSLAIVLCTSSCVSLSTQYQRETGKEIKTLTDKINYGFWLSENNYCQEAQNIFEKDRETDLLRVQLSLAECYLNSAEEKYHFALPDINGEEYLKIQSECGKVKYWVEQVPLEKIAKEKELINQFASFCQGVVERAYQNTTEEISKLPVGTLIR